jgi:hypothetical protein
MYENLSRNVVVVTIRRKGGKSMRRPRDVRVAPGVPLQSETGLRVYLKALFLSPVRLWDQFEIVA